MAPSVAIAQRGEDLYEIGGDQNACGVEQYAYLQHMLAELTRRADDENISDLLPFNYAAAISAQQQTSFVAKVRGVERLRMSAKMKPEYEVDAHAMRLSGGRWLRYVEHRVNGGRKHECNLHLAGHFDTETEAVSAALELDKKIGQFP